MRYSIVFFGLERKRKKKKIKKLLRKDRKEFKLKKIILKNKLFIVSWLIIFNVLVMTFFQKTKNIIFKNEIMNYQIQPTQDEIAIETLKKYEMDLNSINYAYTNAYQKISLNGINILNYSSTRNIDFNKIRDNKIMFDKTKDCILMYHTHTSETYVNSENYKFDYTGTYRTKNAGYNMLKVGEMLGNNLKKYQIPFYQDTTPHDYMVYIDSYKRSANTILKNLKEKDYSIIIDVHRDALQDLTKGMKVNINGKECAQLMFVVGMGTSGVYNKYALDNLSLALNIMGLANTNYPGFFRPMILRNSKYNQDLNKYSLLIECGTSGNTLEEVENSMKLLAKLLNEFYKS